jgi:hypothetical protein
MRYRQFASPAYCGAAVPVPKMASQQEKASCVLRFEVLRSVIAMQREFRARFKNEIILMWCVFFKPCTKLTLHSNHRSEHLKTEHTESLLMMRHHLGNWYRGSAVSMRRELLSAWETWTVPAAVSVCCARVGWEINFLITFETAPFFCVCHFYAIVSSVYHASYLRANVSSYNWRACTHLRFG